jgi:hypothetical protein
MGKPTPVLMTSKDLIAVARVAGSEIVPLMTKLGHKPYCTTSFPSGRNYHKWTAEAFNAVKNWREEKDKTYDAPVEQPPVAVQQPSPIATALADINNMLINHEKEDATTQVLQYLKSIDDKLQQLVAVWVK